MACLPFPASCPFRIWRATRTCSPSSNRTCSSPAYGFPIIFTSRHASAPPLEVSNLVGCLKPHGNHPLLSPLRDPMKSRALSLRCYYRPLRYVCAPPTSRLPDSVFGCPYTEPSRPSPATNEISRVTHNNFPHIPSRRPGKSICTCSVTFADSGGLPHLTTGSALSMTSYEALLFPWFMNCSIPFWSCASISAWAFLPVSMSFSLCFASSTLCANCSFNSGIRSIRRLSSGSLARSRVAFASSI